MDDLNRILGHEWLTRVWTFQEIVLASNPVLVCGQSLIPWSVLQQSLEFYHDNSVISNHLSPVKSDEIESWWFLLIVWTSIPRPTRWHGKTLRFLPQGRRSISVKDYSVQYLEGYQSLSFVLWISWIICILGLVILPWVLASVVATKVTKINTDRLIAAGVTLTVLSFGGITLCTHVISVYFNILNQLPEVEEAVLVGMLKALRERNASVPKDKAFALHGVLQALKIVPRKVSKVESTKSLGQVYYELFRDLLLWNPRLVCLLLDVGPPIPDTPSWVPDWSTHRERSWIENEMVYDAVTSNIDAPRVKIRGQKLIVQGTILGAASFVTGPFDRLDSDNLDTNRRETRRRLASAIAQLSGWLKEISRDVPVSPVYESLPKAILDALYGRVSSFDSPDGPSFNRWRRILCHWDVRGSRRSRDKSLLDRVIADPSALEFTVRICNILSRRRGLFFSTNGHIGSGPPRMLVSDKVALVNGVLSPLILREFEERPGVYSHWSCFCMWIHGFE